MSGQSLGLIETVGLATAVEAADAAMKSAHVTLVGYELTKGGGMVTIKLEGEVGAINAAVAAGVMAARKVGVVYAHNIIARTAQYIENIVYSAETIGFTAAKPEPDVMLQKATIAVVNIEETPQMTCMADAPEAEQTVSVTPEEKKLKPTVAANHKKNAPGRRNKKA